MRQKGWKSFGSFAWLKSSCRRKRLELIIWWFGTKSSRGGFLQVVILEVASAAVL